VTHEVNDLSYVYSVEEIDNIESWCQAVLEVEAKNSLWHVQMGTLLEALGLPSLAESRARQALTLDPLDWRAPNLLAKVVGTDEGIEILTPVINRLESDSQWLQGPIHRIELANTLYMLGLLYWESNHRDTAVPICARAMELDPTNYSRVTMVLSSYAAEDRWSDTINALMTVKEKSTQWLQCLPEMIIKLSNSDRFHQIVLQAALRTQHFSLIEDTYERAIDLLLEFQDRATLCYVRFYYVTTMYALRDRQSKAIAQWEQVLKEDIPQSHSYSALPMLLGKLGPLYLHKAKTSGDDMDAASSYLRELESLLPDGVRENDALLPPRIYLARYYQTQSDGLRAKQNTREIVKQALEPLSDDDEDINIYAYLNSLTVFVPLGEVGNTLASLAMMAIITSDKIRIHCDGGCGNSWSYLGEMLWCRDCINFQFDEECYRKLDDGTLPFTVCDKSHDFFHVPKRGLDTQDIPTGRVPFGEAVNSLEEWMRGIRRIYVDIEH
jgi:tetratricopeptide (TPR) repeat protein